LNVFSAKIFSVGEEEEAKRKQREIFLFIIVLLILQVPYVRELNFNSTSRDLS